MVKNFRYFIADYGGVEDYHELRTKWDIGNLEYI